MSQTVEQTLNESIPVQQQAEKSHGASAGRLTDAQMHDIMGPRDTGKAWLREVAFLNLFGIALPLVMLFLTHTKGGNGIFYFFVLWLFIGGIFAIFVTILKLFLIGQSFKNRDRTMALYDAIQRGEIVVDFHIPYREMKDEDFFLITNDGRVYFPGLDVPLEDLSQISTREKYLGESRKLHLRLAFRNLAEPIQTLWMRSEHGMEQQYMRLLHYLGWK